MAVKKLIRLYEPSTARVWAKPGLYPGLYISSDLLQVQKDKAGSLE